MAADGVRIFYLHVGGGCGEAVALYAIRAILDTRLQVDILQPK